MHKDISHYHRRLSCLLISVAVLCCSVSVPPGVYAQQSRNILRPTPATNDRASTAVASDAGQKRTVKGAEGGTALTENNAASTSAESLPALKEPPATPSAATEVRVTPRSLPVIKIIGMDMSNQKSLSLREAIEMALVNNKDIELERQNVKRAEFSLAGAQGVYDPRFSSSSFFERAENPMPSFLSGGVDGALTQQAVAGSARLEGLAPKYGGNYSLEFSSTRATTNNQFVAINPQYPTALTFNFNQPLRRGLKIDNARRAIEIAKKNLSLTDAQFRQRAMETINNVQQAYWDLVFTLRNLQIQRDAVRDARTQLEHNKRMVAKGSLAPIDIVAAEAQVAQLEQGVYGALEDVARTENGLKNLIAQDHQSTLWNISLIPTDNVDLKPPTLSLPDAFNAALENRPELQQVEVAREINGIDQRYYRDQTKTQIDFVASYSVNGLAGTLNTQVSNPFAAVNAEALGRLNQLSQMNGFSPLPLPDAATLPDRLTGGYGQSIANLALNRYNTVRTGVTISVPLRNRTAQAQLGQTLVESERLKIQRAQLEQLIQMDVRNALQAVQTADARLSAAIVVRQAAEQQAAGEQRKFNGGESTFFFVLERETALTAARGNELRAQTALNKAIAGLQHATGDALNANQIVVQVRQSN